MEPILKREVERLNYVEPGAMLDEIKAPIAAMLQNIPSATKLSNKERKLIREKFQAGFLAFIFQQMMGTQAVVTVAMNPNEQSRFDCAIKGIIGKATEYRLVQLKEFSPPMPGSSPDLQTLLSEVHQLYGKAPELIVGIWLNRDMEFHLKDLRFDELQIGQLWFFGDSGTGIVTVEGGLIADLIAGLCLYGEMKNGRPTGKTLRFK